MAEGNAAADGYARVAVPLPSIFPVYICINDVDLYAAPPSVSAKKVFLRPDDATAHLSNEEWLNNFRYCRGHGDIASVFDERGCQNCMNAPSVRNQTTMAIKEDVRARAPRGTKNVTQAFFEALEGIPDSQRAAVATAALAGIRDEIKARRLKVKEAAAKAKVKAPAKTKAPTARRAKASATRRAPAPASARKQAAAKRVPAKRKVAAKPAKRKSPARAVSPPPSDTATE